MGQTRWLLVLLMTFAAAPAWGAAAGRQIPVPPDAKETQCFGTLVRKACVGDNSYGVEEMLGKTQFSFTDDRNVYWQVYEFNHGKAACWLRYVTRRVAYTDADRKRTPSLGKDRPLSIVESIRCVGLEK
jgi:hypothetical protein